MVDDNKYLTFTRDYLSSSSIRGFPRIVRSKSRISCCIWTVVIILLTVVGSIQLYEVINDFMKWETTQDVREMTASETYFPSITVCNLQPLQSEAGVNRINDYVNFILKLRSKHPDTNFQPLLSYAGLFQNLNHDEINFMSHKLESFVRQCKIQYYLNERAGEIDCNMHEIERLPQPDYFNCFIIHPEKLKYNRTIQAIVEASNSTLFIKSVSLILYLDDFSYPIFPPEFVADAGIKQGIRLAIQPHMEYPDLENGLEIPPGVSATFQLSTTKHHYLASPYGKCEDTERHDIYCSDPTSVYHSPFVYKYSRDLCRKLCLQKEIIDQCACLDPTLPIPEDISVYRQSFLPEFGYLNKRLEMIFKVANNPKRSEAFDCKDVRVSTRTTGNAVLYCLKWTNVFGRECSLPSFSYRKKCWNEIYKRQGSISKCHRIKCTHTCSSLRHNYKHTMSRWPHESYHLAFYKKFIKPEKSLRERFRIYESIEHQLKTNLSKVYEMLEKTNLITRKFVKLQFQQKSPKITVIKDIEQFPVFRLLSSIGGALNLWIGITVVAFVELIELILNLALICIDNRRGNRRVDNYDDPHSQESENSTLEKDKKDYKSF